MAERAHPEDDGFKDRWFGLKKNPYRARLFERYRACNPLIADKLVLDIPCGTGWGTSLLYGYRFLWGIDIADDAIRYARERYERKGRLEFMQGSMEKVPLPDDAVDVVLCLEGFEHVSQASGSEFLRETRRVLRRGGSFVVTCPVLDEHGRATENPHHLYEYPEAELIGLLNESFRIVELSRFRSPDGPEYRAVCENFKDARYDSG